MGTEVIADPCSGGCCGPASCPNCPCPTFTITDYMKVTVAELATMNYTGLPSLFFTNAYIYTIPMALGLSGSERCDPSDVVTDQYETFSATDVFGTSHTIERWLNYNFRPCPPVVITPVAQDRHRFEFYGNTVDRNDLAPTVTKSVTCNIDGTWVITYTFSSTATTVVSGITYTFVFNFTITFEPIP